MDVINFYVKYTEDSSSRVDLIELGKLTAIDPRELREVIMPIKFPRSNFATIKGSKKPFYPKGEYKNLRETTAIEKLEECRAIIITGTLYEREMLQPMFTRQFNVPNLDEECFDLQELLVGVVGTTTVAMVQPSRRGFLPCYAVTRAVLMRACKARELYKSGACGAKADCGTLFAADENEELIIVEDDVDHIPWLTRPGFPGSKLRSKVFGYPGARNTTYRTGPNLISKAVDEPFEIEGHGFLKAAEAGGFFSDKKEVGVMNVVTTNWRRH